MKNSKTTRLGLGLSVGLVLGVLAGCGGNYSNDDVLFRSAIPTRELLASKLTSASAAMRLDPNANLGVAPGPSAGPAAGPTSWTAVGDPSGLAQFTRGASVGFNKGLFAILDVLQAVVTLEPSVRHPDERIWGPYPDRQHPGFEVQLVMDRTAARFEYRVDVRKTGTTDWTKVISGDFQATGGLREGTGSLHFLDEAARGAGYDPVQSDVASIDATYQTQTQPVTVELEVMSVSQPLPILAFTFAGLADGGGQMRFDVSAQLAGGDASPLETLEILSEWKPDGQGRADAQIVAGDLVGASYVECWSAQDAILYSVATWSTPVGDEASCAAF
jgi:hypothetical protein